MRYLLTILFLSSKAFATNYYVANAGNDANDGLTPATAWQTIQKVNSTSFSAGDSILFNRGDSWNEELHITSSGTDGSPIVVGAYGTGNKPVITGFQTVTGFTNISGNVWRIVASNSVDSLKEVLLNGTQAIKARYPNSSYLTYTSSTDSTLVTSLTGTPDYTGKEIAVRTNPFIIDISNVSSQSTGTLHLSPKLTYAPSLGGNGFFFQNDSSFVDTLNEYSYNNSTKALIVYSVGTPTVQISTLDTVLYVNSNDYITFDNLSIEGGNWANIQLDSCNHVIIKNCSINYSGTIGISAQLASYMTISGDSIQNSLSQGIYARSLALDNGFVWMQDTCNYATISGNYIKNTALFAGMGLGGNDRYIGIRIIGSHPNVTNNIIDSIGYSGIYFNGDTSYIYRNFVSNFAIVKDDAGGIYTFIGTRAPYGYDNGSLIRSNIIINGIGTTSGTDGTTSIAAGVYLDNYTKEVTADSNSVYQCKNRGIYLNEADSNNITNNKSFNGTGDAFYVLGSNTYISATGNQIKHNQLYSSSSSWNILNREIGTNLGTIDSNYYSRPSSENNSFDLNGTFYNLSGWQTATGKDLNSKVTPNSTGTANFYYNPTSNDSTIFFPGRRVSLRGIVYEGQITLSPFNSEILFDTNFYRQYYKHYR